MSTESGSAPAPEGSEATTKASKSGKTKLVGIPDAQAYLVLDFGTGKFREVRKDQVPAEGAAALQNDQIKMLAGNWLQPALTFSILKTSID